MPAGISPIQTITTILRGLGPAVGGISWANTASPFYEQQPEPPLDPTTDPFVVFTLRSTGLEHVMGQVDFCEMFEAAFTVYAGQDVIDALTSPFSPTGLYYQLDLLSEKAGSFSGSTFECAGWARNSGWAITMEAIRAPSGQRVWASRASYEMIINRKN